MPLLLICELGYLVSCLVNTPPLLRTLVSFPSLFVIPGMVILLFLKNEKEVQNVTRLVIESFFLSSIISVIFALVLALLSIPMLPIFYSLMTLAVVSLFAVFGSARKVEFKPGKFEIFQIILAFLIFAILLFLFSQFPRLLTPDETSYLSSARTTVLGGVAPPMGITPAKSELVAMLSGRYFWIYLLSSFIGSTGLPAYQGGLISVGFIVMIALTSSLIVKGTWARMAVFSMIVLDPLLLLFAGSALNDLTIAFYAVFASLFFLESFSKIGNEITVSTGKLAIAFMGLFVLELIKPNLLIVAIIWIITVIIMYQRKFYKRCIKDKILFGAITLPVMLYELCIDLPYCLSAWVLRSKEASLFFGRFLFVSPIENLLGLFATPWWNSVNSSLFSKSVLDFSDYFYRFFMPESSGLIVAAVTLVIPIFVLSKKVHELNEKLLALLVFISVWIFFFLGLSSQSLSDISRLSLWLIPLWVPMAIIILESVKEKTDLIAVVSLLCASSFFLYVNIWLTGQTGGVFIGQDLPARLVTTNNILIQLIVGSVTVCLLFALRTTYNHRALLNFNSSFFRTDAFRKGLASILIIMTLLNGLYFSIQFLATSDFYKSNNSSDISNVLGKVWGNNEIVFANNYIQLRPYVNNTLFKKGLILPPPASGEEFSNLVENAPNNTLLIVSNDAATTWYEYANSYIKNYATEENIVPEAQNVNLSKISLPDRFLYLNFDNTKEGQIVDESGLNNIITNHEGKIIDGPLGKALNFDGNSIGYVSIPDNELPKPSTGLSISFCANVSEDLPQRGYMILSKGYAPENGSYDIFLWDTKLYFSIGGVGSLSVSMEKYVGTWHWFLFVYDGISMTIYVDGQPVSSKIASGLIRSSNFDLEIGRDSERGGSFYIGSLDEIQISYKAVNFSSYFGMFSTPTASSVINESDSAKNFNLFKITYPNETSQIQSNVMTFDKASVSTDNDLATNVALDINSSSPENVTILLGTDRFTEVRELSLNGGLNHLEFKFDYDTSNSSVAGGGYFWQNTAQIRILVIDANGNLRFNSFLSIQNLSFMSILLLIVSILIASAFIFASRRLR